MRLHRKLLVLLVPPLIAGLGLGKGDTSVSAMPLTGTSGDGSRLFLRIEGVPGASLDPRYRDWIELDRYALDVDHPSSGASPGRSAESPVVGPLRASGLMLRAFPLLAGACTTGRRIMRVELAVVAQHPKANLETARITMEGVSIDSMRTVADLTPSLNTEVALDFERIRVESRTIKADGSLGPARRWGWDVTTNSRW